MQDKCSTPTTVATLMAGDLVTAVVNETRVTHTRGPWWVRASSMSDPSSFAVMAAVTFQGLAPKDRPNEPSKIKDGIIARAYPSTGVGSARVALPSEANGRLIAAAPDLLAALKLLKWRIHFIGMPQEPRREDGAPDWRAEIAALEAAIAKAEGRS